MNNEELGVYEDMNNEEFGIYEDVNNEELGVYEDVDNSEFSTNVSNLSNSQHSAVDRDNYGIYEPVTHYDQPAHNNSSTDNPCVTHRRYVLVDLLNKLDVHSCCLQFISCCLKQMHVIAKIRIYTSYSLLKFTLV
jgi:hypothetical protein